MITNCMPRSMWRIFIFATFRIMADGVPSHPGTTSGPPRRTTEKPRFKNMGSRVSFPPKDLYTVNTFEHKGNAFGSEGVERNQISTYKKCMWSDRHRAKALFAQLRYAFESLSIERKHIWAHRKHIWIDGRRANAHSIILKSIWLDGLHVHFHIMALVW